MKVLSTRIEDDQIEFLTTLAEERSMIEEREVSISDVIRGMIMNKMFLDEKDPLRKLAIPTTRRDLYRYFEFFTFSDPHINLMIDRLSHLVSSGAHLSGENRKMFEEKLGNIDIADLFSRISRQFFSIGDVFIEMKTDCLHCPDGTLCHHENVGVSRFDIIDPMNVEVIPNPLDPSGVARIMLKPSMELKRMVKTESPAEVFASIPPSMVNMIKNDIMIPADPEMVHHIKRKGEMRTYGESIIHSMLGDLLWRDEARCKAFREGHLDKKFPPSVTVDEEVNRIYMEDCRRSIERWFEDRVLGFIARRNGIEETPKIWWNPNRTKEKKWQLLLAWKEGCVSDSTVKDELDLSD